MTNKFNLYLLQLNRWRAGCLHAGVSVAIGLASAFVVFGVWYPYPFREMSGGRELFLLLVAVDVILGPVITFVIFNHRKPWRELKRDLMIVFSIQLAALCYGVWIIFTIRPVHMVFEIDRFRVVHAIEVDVKLLPGKSKDVWALPILGPTLLALRPFKDEKERMDATLMALQGVTLASRPDLWCPYEEATAEVLKEAKPATLLLSRFAPRASEIARVLKDVNRAPQNVVYLPLVGPKSFGTVFLDPVTAQVLTTMPLDSF